LPSFRSFTSSASLASVAGRSRDSEELSKEVSKIGLEGEKSKEITAEERANHAKLILDLMVAINAKYKEQYGPAKSSKVETTANGAKLERSPVDVEMTVVG
jgi:hypothetical protein